MLSSSDFHWTSMYDFDKMKLFLVAACLMVAAFAAPNDDPETSSRRALPVLEHKETRDERGQYTLYYRTAEGTEVTEEGRLVPTPDENAYVLVVKGETKFVGTDGKLYITKYNAGLDGSHMEGSHIPVLVLAEPVPEIIARISS